MKASLKNYRQPPRKVRLVADLIRGKSVPVAQAALKYLPKKAAPEISQLLDSAVANAAQLGVLPETLIVKKISVDKGTVMRRYRPFARGRAGTIRKAMSHVNIELAVAPQKPAKKARAKKPVTAAKK